MSVFRFKQFSVEQKQSPAKITTDATVFASALQVSPSARHALEIGTGTGVLSLMLAQRFPDIKIDALEINPEAYKEANYNFNNSKWKHRLTVDLKDFNHFVSEKKYDLIFSNPPFFQNNLQSELNHGRNIAYHTNTLSFEALAKGIEMNLVSDGEAQIMLPVYEMSLLENEMKKLGFNTVKNTELRHQIDSKVIRLFYGFEKGEVNRETKIEKIYIRDENNDFHPSYINLMKDFLTIF
ncbi:tRNA1(Val) (adenine(37)-N6)-methyltransferase [Marivirga sp.]|uniref:tRNA1(Val) (adenine(37)-N6)-methyltransferase n=1 Tax=Marivirga sp. TaxID=2018662 RepID=UPI002D80CB2A|nr:methyltransferase [Marivirga sp.]HET8860169.1 methyltransferase [Marivirga sp.]